MTTKGKRGLKMKWDWCIPFFSMLGILLFTTCLQAAESRGGDRDSVKFMVKGTVVDKSGQPLEGVSIFVTKSDKRIFTGKDGKFSLMVNKGARLVIYLQGKVTKEVRADVKKEMRVVMLNAMYMEERMPYLLGEDVMQYVVRNIKYPKDALEMKVQGKVFVQFIVEKDGSLSNVRVIRPVYPSLDEEACRVIRGMSQWSPGIQKGKPVRVSYTLPINFSLR